MIVLALGLAACGGDDGGEAEGRELDRCALLTAGEAAEWLGEPVEVGPSEILDEDPDPVTCLYEGSRATVLVQVRDGAVYFAERGSDARTGEDVSDLGEDAFGDSESVKFLQNDWAVSVSRIIGLVDEDALLEMARVISGRLP